MSGYVARIRAEWLAAGFEPMPQGGVYYRTLTQQVAELYRQEVEVTVYLPATLLNDREIS